MIDPLPSSPLYSSKRLQRRHRAEKRFRWYGKVMISFSLAFLVLIFAGIGIKGYSAFRKAHIALDITFDADVVQPKKAARGGTPQIPEYSVLIRRALLKQATRVESTEREEKIRDLMNLISPGASATLHDFLEKNPWAVGQTHRLWLRASDDVDQWWKARLSLTKSGSRLTHRQVKWMEHFAAQNRLSQYFNFLFFSRGDSRYPEQSGIWGAFVGSLYTMLVTLALAFPLAISSAIYLEEFSSPSRFSRFIEVNISNLAAVPSIVYGLLGLAIFLNIFGLPRSSALVGGMTLALMTMPTMVIAARTSLRSVPRSIREAARGLGASTLQVTFHHVFPLALPGMLTGTILGMARALGESAPLLMIGMVAFIVDVPENPLDPATVLPVQIFNWARNPERGFVENTAAAIIILLLFLVAMNMAAILLRKRLSNKTSMH